MYYLRACLCMRGCVLCVKDRFFVPRTPRLSLVPQTMLPLYAHDTGNTHVQTWADAHYAGWRVSGAVTRGTMSLDFVIAFHSDFPLLRRQRKGSLMPLHTRNHDAERWATSGWAEKKRSSIHKRRWLEEGGVGGVPGIPRYTVDTLLWHLQGRLDRYSVIRVWERLSSWCDCYEGNNSLRANLRAQAMALIICGSCKNGLLLTSFGLHFSAKRPFFNLCGNITFVNSGDKQQQSALLL